MSEWDVPVSSNSSDLEADDVGTSDNVSTAQYAVDFNEVEDTADQRPMLQLAAFNEVYEPGDDEFSQFVYQRDVVSSSSTRNN